MNVCKKELITKSSKAENVLVSDNGKNRQKNRSSDTTYRFFCRGICWESHSNYVRTILNNKTSKVGVAKRLYVYAAIISAESLAYQWSDSKWGQRSKVIVIHVNTPLKHWTFDPSCVGCQEHLTLCNMPHWSNIMPSGRMLGNKLLVSDSYTIIATV